MALSAKWLMYTGENMVDELRHWMLKQEISSAPMFNNSYVVQVKVKSGILQIKQTPRVTSKSGATLHQQILSLKRKADPKMGS